MKKLICRLFHRDHHQYEEGFSGEEPYMLKYCDLCDCHWVMKYFDDDDDD